MSDANFRKALTNYDDKVRAYTNGLKSIRQDQINFEEELSEALIKVNHAMLVLAGAVECEARAATDQRITLFDLANEATTYDEGTVKAQLACAEARKLAVDSAKKRLEEAQKELSDLLARQRGELTKGVEALAKAVEAAKPKK